MLVTSALFSTKTFRKFKELFCSFSIVNFRAGCSKFNFSGKGHNPAWNQRSQNYRPHIESRHLVSKVYFHESQQWTALANIFVCLCRLLLAFMKVDLLTTPQNQVFWNLLTSWLKNQSCVGKKSLFSHWDSSSKQWLIGPNWSHLRPIRSILSHVTASGYIFRLTFRSLSDVFILWWVSDEESFQYVKGMLPLFRVVVKYDT